MPTYRYQCEECGHELEEFQRMTEEPLVRCPACGKDALARIIGGGGGVIFKGSGFYRTDYRKEPPKTTPEAKEPPKKEGEKSPNKGSTDSPEKK